MKRKVFLALHFLNQTLLPKYSGRKKFKPRGVHKLIVAYKYWISVNSLKSKS